MLKFLDAEIFIFPLNSTKMEIVRSFAFLEDSFVTGYILGD